MHADICDPNDEAAVARFRDALRRLGAQLVDKGWGIGVDHYCLPIGDEELSIFCDACSLDIEGFDDLIGMVLREFTRDAA